MILAHLCYLLPHHTVSNGLQLNFPCLTSRRNDLALWFSPCLYTNVMFCLLAPKIDEQEQRAIIKVELISGAPRKIVNTDCSSVYTWFCPPCLALSPYPQWTRLAVLVFCNPLAHNIYHSINLLSSMFLFFWQRSFLNWERHMYLLLTAEILNIMSIQWPFFIYTAKSTSILLIHSKIHTHTRKKITSTSRCVVPMVM